MARCFGILVLWCYGRFNFMKINSSPLNLILIKKNLATIPKHHKTTIPSDIILHLKVGVLNNRLGTKGLPSKARLKSTQ